MDRSAESCRYTKSRPICGYLPSQMNNILFLGADEMPKYEAILCRYHRECLHQPYTTKTSHCVTEECIACQQDIRRRLTEIGLGHFNVPKRSNTPCNRYHFSSYDYEDSDEDSDSESSEERMFVKHHFRKSEERSLGKHHFREPRYARSNFVGTRFNISCVRKGNVIGEQGFISLCSSCWAWRTLPSNYIPRILNELICDTRDDACLSGYAKCKEGLRNLEVIRNDSGVLTTVLLTSGTYCECRAMQQSPIYNLIVGSDVNGK